jgi:glucose-1-phosphate thymidylyltransferase
LGRGFAWLDTGTHESLHQAGSFIQTLEDRQGVKVACVEEIAFRLGYISGEDLAGLAGPLAKSSYGRYLLDVLKEDPPVDFASQGESFMPHKILSDE